MSLQRFEGSSLEAVLEEARAAAGPGVRIVEANRLRKGGIGGFFSKERFEVAVEMGEAPAPTVDEPARVRPTGVDAVDRVLADVAAVVGSPLSEHVRVFEQAHERLRRALDAQQPAPSGQHDDVQGS